MNGDMRSNIKNAANLFKSLCDPNRLRILKMLQVKPLCVCEITKALELAASTVSQHLKILKESGFIIEEKEGKWVNYLINPCPSDKRVYNFLNALDFWIENDAAVEADKKRVMKSDRNLICSK